MSLLNKARKTWAIYAQITKQGLVLFVVFSAYVNYLFVAKESASVLTWLALFLGAYLAASGAHVINQAVEYKYDKLMPRTAARPVPAGLVSPLAALLAGLFLVGSGVLVQLLAVNFLTAAITFLTVVLYILVYTPLKRKTVWNTWVGAVPGAMAALTGGTAVSGVLNFEIFIFPIIIFFWQIPHFLSLSWKYRHEYQKAGFKMLAAEDERGLKVAVLMITHTLVLLKISTVPYFLGDLSLFYLLMAIILGSWFLVVVIKFWQNRQDFLAKKIFLRSNFYLLGLFIIFLADKKLF